jgi:RNA polymerase sigma factor (sigma-70 family)
MSGPAPLDALLEKLSAGNPQAAEQVFRTFEPYLRMVVRRQLSAGLRAKFDSMDIVQSVWADVLDGFRSSKWSFRDAEHLKAFLVRVTRNRFVDRLRTNRPALERERSLPQPEMDALPASRQGGVSETARVDELWQQVLDACPPAHCELVRLKRDGVPLAEIATRTGLHESSVRRILYDVARRLEQKQRVSAASPPAG